MVRDKLTYTPDGDRKEVAALRSLKNLNAMFDRLGYGFSSARFGNMSVRWELEKTRPHLPEGQKEDPNNVAARTGAVEEVVAGREKYFAEIAGFATERMVVITPVAGNDVLIVGKEDCGRDMPPADALITIDKEVVLVLKPADCTPIIITNKGGDFVAMVHAGRDGTNLQIVKNVIDKLREMGFDDPSDFVVGMGPTVECYHGDFFSTNDPEMWLPHLYVSIGEDAETDVEFRVSEESANSKWKYRIVTEPKREMFVDITECNVAQLVALGVPRENIETAGICTFCNAQQGRMYSHGWSSRKENASAYPVSRFLAYAVLK